MLTAKFDIPQNRDAQILCLGAHCDDIEIGCGGALLSILKNNPNVAIHWVVFASTESRRKEAKEAAMLFTAAAKNAVVKIYDLRDGFLPYYGKDVKELFEQIKTEVTPDLIFTHYRNDLHQDHRMVSELTWNTFRNHMIFEYEIPKWDGDFGVPNTFIPIEQALAKNKIEYLQSVYNSQQKKKWFTDDLFWSIMRLRGMESNSPTNLSEGFYTRKLSLAFDCSADALS